MSGAGLYDPRFEHDSCGVGFVADLSGASSSVAISSGPGSSGADSSGPGSRRGHDVVAKALRVLRNLEHRGAAGGDPETGDGAGILTQVPDEFFRAVCGWPLPEPGSYAVGTAFLTQERAVLCPLLESLAAAEGLTVLGWREVPHNPRACGPGARAVMPELVQLFVAGARGESGLDLERMAFCLRKRAEREAGVYFASLSARTIVYKGMLSAPQLEPFYPDLSDPRFGSALALVHSRFSTNTFPSWPLAHPYRYIAHNGEINTIRGNRNWMRAREAMLASDLIPRSRDDRGIERLFPILDSEGSDSASFDECLELLHLGGRSLPHSVLMMIPEPWENHEEMPPDRRAFYAFHAALMEPWDGPALIAFTDGTMVGAVLDRNGLRPGRYWLTDDGLVVVASEVGVLDIDPATVTRKGRLQPGRIFLADTAAGRIVEDDEVKTTLASKHPYESVLHAGQIHLSDLPDPGVGTTAPDASLPDLGVGMAGPDAGVPHFGIGTTRAGAGLPDLGVGMAGPDAGVPHFGIGTTRAGAGLPDPGVGMAGPDAGVPHFGIGTTRAGAGLPDPGVGTTAPDARPSEPGGRRPGTRRFLTPDPPNSPNTPIS